MPSLMKRDPIQPTLAPVPWLTRELKAVFPETTSPVSWASSRLATASFLVLGTVCCLLRQTGTSPLKTLYAEDGSVFLAGAANQNALEGVLSPYMGYLHAVPRLVAEAAATGPLRWAAVIIAFAAAFMVAGTSWFVFRASEGRIRSTPVRLGLAASVLLLPMAQDEAFNNVANVHWFLMFASFWAMLWRPWTRWEVSLAVVVVLAAALSDPIVILLTPVVLMRLATVNEWRDRAVVIAWAAGLSVQLAVLLVTGTSRAFSPTLNLATLATLYGGHVVGRGLAGRLWLTTGDTPVAYAVTVLALALLGIAVVFALRRGNWPAGNSLLLLTMALSSVAFFGVPVGLTGTAPARYSIVPTLLLFSGVACLLDGWVGLKGHRSDSSRLIVGAVLTTLIGTVWATNFRIETDRSDGPTWSAGLAQAEEDCRNKSPERVQIEIPPSGWNVELACADL